MKFVYQYRTSDNVRHEGVVSAANRDAAFAALKSQGVRPSSLQAAPGFFNKLMGCGKRGLAIAALAVLCGMLAIHVGRDSGLSPEATAIADTLDSPVRRQLIGDAAVIEFGIRMGWQSVFIEEGDQFLASFAVPGVSPGKRNVTEDLLRRALERPEPVGAGDSIEARQIKAIVAGMKDEIRQLLHEGWTLSDVGVALVRRQEREIAHGDLL